MLLKPVSFSTVSTLSFQISLCTDPVFEQFNIGKYRVSDQQEATLNRKTLAFSF